MNKKFHKYIIVGAIIIVGTIGYNISFSQEDSDFQLMMGNVLVGECWGSVDIIEDCHVTCVCGKKYYSNPRVYNAMPHRVTGRCSCGNTIFPQ